MEKTFLINKKIVTVSVLIAALFVGLFIFANKSFASSLYESVSDNDTTETEETVSMGSLDGVEFPIDSEEIDISYHKFSINVGEFHQQLKAFPNIKKVIMCDTSYTNENMEMLQKLRPDVEFVWMLHFSNKWKCRTDAKAFSTWQDKGYVITISNKDAWQFKYCTQMQFLDIGHNTITDMSFLQYMPDLHGLIVHQNYDRAHGGRMRDLSYLKYCPKLTYLEIFDSDIWDLSFLQYTPELRDLLASQVPIEDVTYLMDLPNLERLYIQATKISREDYEKLRERYPDVELVYFGFASVTDPSNRWRYSPKSGKRARSIRGNYLDPIFFTNEELEEYNRMLEEQAELEQ